MFGPKAPNYVKGSVLAGLTWVIMGSQSGKEDAGWSPGSKSDVITRNTWNTTLVTRHSQSGQCMWDAVSVYTEELTSKWGTAVQKVCWWQVQSGESVVDRCGTAGSGKHTVKHTCEEKRGKEKHKNEHRDKIQASVWKANDCKWRSFHQSWGVLHSLLKTVGKCVQWLWRSFVNFEKIEEFLIWNLRYKLGFEGCGILPGMTGLAKAWMY